MTRFIERDRLTPSEQQKLEAFLQAHPEEQAKAEVLEVIVPLLQKMAEEPDEEVIELYMAEKADWDPLPLEPLSPAERTWVELQLTYNPEWQAVWHELEEEFGATVPLPEPTPDAALKAATETPADRSRPEAAAIRPPVEHQRRRRWTTKTFAVATSLVLLAVLLVPLLYFTPILKASFYDQASLEEQREEISRLLSSPRTPNETPTDYQGYFIDGLSKLNEAPQRRFLIFHTYDQERAQAAVSSLEQAFRLAGEPREQARAAFYLAKAHLMQQQKAEALDWLTQVKSSGARDYQDETDALLEQLNVPGAR